jgi:hypothetical protein
VLRVVVCAGEATVDVLKSQQAPRHRHRLKSARAFGKDRKDEKKEKLQQQTTPHAPPCAPHKGSRRLHVVYAYYTPRAAQQPARDATQPPSRRTSEVFLDLALLVTNRQKNPSTMGLFSCFFGSCFGAAPKSRADVYKLDASGRATCEVRCAKQWVGRLIGRAVTPGCQIG